MVRYVVRLLGTWYGTWVHETGTGARVRAHGTVHDKVHKYVCVREHQFKYRLNQVQHTGIAHERKFIVGICFNIYQYFAMR